MTVVSAYPQADHRRSAHHRAPHHRAGATIRIGRHTRLSARIDVTTPGLLAVGALVSSILLSTAVLVRASVRDGTRANAIQY